MAPQTSKKQSSGHLDTEQAPVFNEATFFVFDGDKVVISPDLLPIISFLQEIEKEVKSMLEIDRKMLNIRSYFKELFKLIEKSFSVLKEQSLTFEHTLSQNPIAFLENTTIKPFTRSKVVALFAYLDTLFCLNLAYEKQTYDKEKIIGFAMNKKEIDSFLNRFCLHESNKWGQKNPDRLRHLTTKDLRELRNCLTHFFSVQNKVCVADDLLNEKSRELERKTNFQGIFISPEDLLEIINGAVRIMITRWNNDHAENQKSNSDEFGERITCVKNIVHDNGAIIVKNSDVHI